jgi:hypothetical protein
MNAKLLKDIGQGGAFNHNGTPHIAISQSSEETEIICLDTMTKEIVFLEHETIVEEIENWYVSQFHKAETIARKIPLARLPIYL